MTRITVGFAELAEADSAMDLVNRADGDFLSAHRARSRGDSPDAAGPSHHVRDIAPTRFVWKTTFALPWRLEGHLVRQGALCGVGIAM